eukprot:5611731-Pyramimonas_sp.AAC.1
MGASWTTAQVRMCFKGIVFVGVVIDAALSGLEAYVLNVKTPIARQSLGPLEQHIYKYARVVLHGKRTHRSERRVRAPSNREVQRLMKFGSLLVELRVRRLKWLQDIVVKQREHRQVIAALVGQAQWEAANFEVSSDGEALPAAHARTKQFWADVQA